MESITLKQFTVLLNRDAYEKALPIFGAFELTPLCNLDCKMCYVHLQNPTVRNRMLRGNQWLSVMQEAIDCGLFSALLTGGEAMTHPDFWNIYMFLIDHGVSVRVKTNGILLNGQNIERFKTYPPHLIDISLYGCDSDSYLAVTGVDAYQRVVDNIRMAIDAGLCIRIMITPSGYMSPWTERVMELAKSFGVKVIVNSVLIEPDENTGRRKQDFDLTESENARIREKRDELFPLKFMSPEEENEIYGSIEKRADIQEKGLYCNGGRTSFAINWDGTMGPCLSFPRDIVCAHPLTDGFETAWHQVNECVRNYTVPDKCRSCRLNTKCHYCPTQHGKMAARHKCDPQVCSYWANVYKKEDII